MAYSEHPEFTPPSAENAKIWRYMDLAKFLSLIESESLYFVRLDQLSEFDPFEGYYTNLNLEFDKLEFENMSEQWKKLTGINDKKIFDVIALGNKNTRDMVKYHRSASFVNSWHIKEHESAAMWKIYLSNNEGIAIQSTFKKLINSMESYDDFEIHIGKIKYINYDTEVIPMGNTLSPFIYKRKSFEYEDELRALIWTPQHGKNNMLDPEKNKFKDTFGLNVPVDIDILIEKIYVSPNAPKWILEVIEKIVKRFELKKEVTQSDLALKPIY